VEREEAVEKLLMLLRQPGLKIRDAARVFSALERLRAANVGFLKIITQSIVAIANTATTKGGQSSR